MSIKIIIHKKSVVFFPKQKKLGQKKEKEHLFRITTLEKKEKDV